MNMKVAFSAVFPKNSQPTTQPTICHGRGRGFESRRPRHSFQKRCPTFGETIEDPKGHVFVPFLGSFFALSICPYAATSFDPDNCDVAFASQENTNDMTAA
jgi:hypothetical protein